MHRQKIRHALILISLLLFPVTLNYLSPYLIIEGASNGIIAGSFITFTLLFLSGLIFGRAFCGWVCPGAGLQEACFKVQPRRVHRGNWVKYLIWIPWLAAIISVTLSVKGFHTIDPFFMTDHGISVSDLFNYIPFYAVISLITILAFTIGKRSFCHHVCWMAPFMIIARKFRNLVQWPALHLEASPEKCTHCKKCAQECPMSLEVEQMAHKTSLENAECILCGNCIDVCPKKAIYFAFTNHNSTAKRIDATIHR